MDGIWLWIGLVLLTIVLAMSGRNEWQGIQFLMKRIKGHPGDFPRQSHRMLGKASIMLSIVWGVAFITRAPTLFRQFTPGFNALLVFGVLGLAIVTLLTGWLLTRRKQSRFKIMIHQAGGYFFVMLIAGLLMLACDENLF